MKTIEQRVKELEQSQRPAWASVLWAAVIWGAIYGVAMALEERFRAVEEKVGIVQPSDGASKGVRR